MSTIRVFTVLLVGVILVAFSTQATTARNIERQFLYPPAKAKFMTLGYHEIVSDALWIRVIQDFDVCDQAAENAKKSLDQTPWESKGVPIVSLCTNGWVSSMLEVITNLTPKFKQPYEFGAPMLSIVVDDRTGASRIFARGVKEFPDNWRFHFNYAYHALYGMKDTALAAQEAALAAQSGAPAWVYALAARLYSKSGQLELGIRMLESLDIESVAADDRAQIQKRLTALKAELAQEDAKPSEAKSTHSP